MEPLHPHPPHRRPRAPTGNLTHPLKHQRQLLIYLTSVGLSNGYAPLDAVKRAKDILIHLKTQAKLHLWSPDEQDEVIQLVEWAVRLPGRDSGVNVAGRAVEAWRQVSKVMEEWKKL